MKKRRKNGPLAFAVIAVLLVGAVFLLRWGHERLLKSMYPRSYASIVAARAKENGLDPNLVYAVIRQESGFQAGAQSGAGAVGLMQLTPDTFEWLQRKEGAQDPLSSDALTQPDVNVRYGCRFLALLLNRYGVRRTALCAYNAGIGRVDSWLGDASLSKDGRNLDAIPYAETQNYVEKVEENYRQYRDLYSK